MKRITLFFAVLLGLSVFQTASGVDSETARAAKRSSANTISTNTTSTRSTTSSKSGEQKHNENARSTVKNNRSAQSVQPRTVTTKPQPTIRQRSATPVQKTNTQTKTVSARNSATGARGTAVSRSAVSRKAVNIKPTATRSTVNKNTNRIVRAAELNEDKINEIKAKDFSKCKTVYWECMDEFCANKDTTLRRCACSTRIHEFDDIKQQLNDTEEKMLGFNQTLLTVSLDKEDALAINSATEGELAFGKKDTSESEKLLQKITDTLNTSSDSKINSNLSAISLDLDMESAWDTVDSTAGIATTAKSGLGLYNAAQPVCLEMAREVCSDSEFSIAESSYKLAIQQDCDTVANAYKSKYNEAMNKVHESSALLDMARLNAHQQRNSDDVLTCKQKILDKLSESAVCGENLYRCLDITGQYIDQSDGSAFLSANLFNMTTLLTAPATTDIKWSRVPGNEEFVTFLNSKRNYLETATEKCQDVADMVWKDFIEDALAQIKLAQNAKLEEIRRSCVRLIAECKTSALTSIENFDTNALSTFKIQADATVNAMCADVQSACMALIDSSTGNSEWSSATAGIETEMTYEAMVENCTAVGRTCLIQHCNGTDGNFALCTNTTSYPRQLIIRAESCWQEVQKCVAQVGTEKLKSMSVPDFTEFDSKYNNNATHCGETDTVCLIAHKIWGDCDVVDQSITEEDQDWYLSGSNTIKDNSSSLLGWFSEQTHNEKCIAESCTVLDGYEPNYLDYNYGGAICLRCPKKGQQTTDGKSATANQIITVYKDPNDATQNITNYCAGECPAKDEWGNCCASTGTIQKPTDPYDDEHICVKTGGYTAVKVQTVTCNTTDSYYCPEGSNGKKITLYCMTTDPDTYPKFTSAYNIQCGSDNDTGFWVLIDDRGNYFNPKAGSNGQIYGNDLVAPKPEMSYKRAPNDSLQCRIRYKADKWNARRKSTGVVCEPDINPKNRTSDNQLMITY